ncbi:hypothetical protein JCM8208_004956 [Rhodotorula glutinis]
MSLVNEPDQALLQELERKLQRVAHEVARIRAEPAQQRPGMTLGDLLNECGANKEKVADEFLEAALSLQTFEHPDGKKISQVDVVKMLTGAMPALHSNTFRTALNALVPFVQEWDKLDVSEARFKKQHKFDELERIHKQLMGQLVEAHGPAAALSVLEDNAEQIEGLYAGTVGDRSFRHAMRASIDGAATAEKQVPKLQKAYKAEADGSPQRQRLKKSWRLAQGLEELYMVSSTAKPYAELRDRIRPYKRFLSANHKDLLRASRIKMVRSMGGGDTSSSMAPIQEQSMSHLSLRQRHIYFGRRERVGRW